MNTEKTTNYAIVADIGGTFARFSRVNLEDLTLDEIKIYPCADYISLESVLITYRMQHGLSDLRRVALAIACPVEGDLVCMTNCHWRFSINELKTKLNLEQLIVCNDFNAIALSLPVLSPSECMQIGCGLADKNKPSVILGAGTGLGVAYLIPQDQGYRAYAGEGGHASWGARNEQEWFIYNYLTQKYGHVSYERLLSGHGLEGIYYALAAYFNQEVALIKAAQIIERALIHDAIALAAVKQFFASLGAYAGDLALTFAAFGGVYIAGGIVPRVLSLIQESDFRARFEDKGRFKQFNTAIPTYVITAEQPGILGAAVHLKYAKTAQTGCA